MHGDRNSKDTKPQTLDPDAIRKILDGMPRLSEQLSKESFGCSITRGGPNFYKAHEYSADNCKVALRHQKEAQAKEALSGRAQLEPDVPPVF